MTLIEAERGCELLLGCALVQQSLEHCFGPLPVRWLFVPRLLLALLLVVGVAPLPVLAALCVLGVGALVRFDGAYNGGSGGAGNGSADSFARAVTSGTAGLSSATANANAGSGLATSSARAESRDTGVGNGSACAFDTQLFDEVVGFTNASRINQLHRNSVDRKDFAQSVARGAGKMRDNGAIFAQ